MQKGHHTAFKNQKLQEMERLYSIYDEEMLAILHTLEKFK